MEFFKKGLCVILCAVILFSLFGCGNAAKEEKPTENTLPSVNQTEESGTEVWREQFAEFGLSNALDELEELSNVEADGQTYVKYQQKYQGIPVWGNTVVRVTDSEGKIVGAIGNLQDVNPQVSLKATASEEQIRTAVEKYAKDNLGTEFTLGSGITQEENRVIYQKKDSEDFVLAYTVSAGAEEFLVDANSGEILSHYSGMRPDRVTCYDAASESEFIGYQDADQNYVLMDMDRNILILDAQNKTYCDFISENGGYRLEIHPEILKLITSNDPIFGNQGDPESAQTGYELMELLGKMQDFYADLGEENCGLMVGICNDKMSTYEGSNAGGGYENIAEMLSGVPYCHNEKNPNHAGLMTVGTEICKSLGTNLDTLGHEFTHYIAGFHHSMRESENETLALSEGVADIMGELIEAKLEGKEPDWILADRDAKDPKRFGYPASRYDAYAVNLKDGFYVHLNGTTDYSHFFATIVFHTAYLMYNGIDGNADMKFSQEELAKFWLDVIRLSPMESSYAKCRSIADFLTETRGYTEKQKECVQKAFDMTGMKISNKNKGLSFVTPDSPVDRESVAYIVPQSSEWIVYDYNGEVWNDYILRIDGRIAVHNTPYVGITQWEDYNAEYRVTSTEPLKIELQPEYIYQFIIVNGKDENQNEPFRVYVNKDGLGETSCDVYVAFKGVSSETADLSAYIPVIEDTLSKLKSQAENWVLWEKEAANINYGLLYDLDGNGIEEMILAYFQNGDNAGTMQSDVCSVYTLENGKPVLLIERENLFEHVAAPMGYIHIVQSEKGISLRIINDNGYTMPPYVVRTGTTKQFKIAGASVQQEGSAEYSLYSKDKKTDYAESKATINGNACTFAEYEEWLAQNPAVFSVTKGHEGYTAAGSEEVVCGSLEELLECISPSGSTVSSPAWAEIYADFIKQDKEKTTDIPQKDWHASYELLYLDSDDVPELYIDYGVYANGCRLATISNGRVESVLLGEGMLQYKPYENYFLSCSGHMGVYYDQILRIENGSFAFLDKGNKDVDTPEYRWNNQVVTKAEYDAYLAYFENAQMASFGSENAKDYDEMLNYLWIGEFEQPEKTMQSTNMDAFSAYKQFLADNESTYEVDDNGIPKNGFSQNNSESIEKTTRFGMLDLDGDGENELITLHWHGYKTIELYIWKFADGSIVRVGDMIPCYFNASGYYRIFLCKENHLHTQWQGPTPVGFMEEWYIWSIENGELVKHDASNLSCGKNDAEVNFLINNSASDRDLYFH